MLADGDRIQAVRAETAAEAAGLDALETEVALGEADDELRRAASRSPGSTSASPTSRTGSPSALLGALDARYTPNRKVRAGLWKVDLRHLDFGWESNLANLTVGHVETVSLRTWEHRVELRGWAGTLPLLGRGGGLSNRPDHRHLRWSSRLTAPALPRTSTARLPRVRVVRVPRASQHFFCVGGVSRVHDDLSRSCRVPRCPEAETLDALVVGWNPRLAEQLGHDLRLRLVVGDRYRELVRHGWWQKPVEDSGESCHSRNLGRRDLPLNFSRVAGG